MFSLGIGPEELICLFVIKLTSDNVLADSW